MPARLNADASTSQSVSLLLKIWRCTENPCNHFYPEMHDLHVRDDKYYQSTTMRRSYVHYSHARKTGFIDSIGPASEIFTIFYYAEICYRLCRIVARVFVCFHVDTYISTRALISRFVLVYIYRLALVDTFHYVENMCIHACRNYEICIRSSEKILSFFYYVF